MANPIKRLQWIVGLLLLGGTAWVGWLLMQADIQPAAPIVERVEPAPGTPVPVEPSAEADGEASTGRGAAGPADGTGTCVEGFRSERLQSVRGLTAGLACLQEDGSWSMEQGVRIRLEGQGQAPPLTVDSRTGVLPPDGEGPQPLVFEGDVRVSGEGGFELETERLELYRLRTLVVSPGPVRFRREEASGTAGSLEHDWGADETRLGGGARVVLAGSEVGDRPVTVVGARIRFRDESSRVEVRGQASIDLDGGRVSGEQIDVTLASKAGDDDATDAEVRRVEARGGAETLAAGGGFGAGGGSVATRRLRAATIVHEFGPGNALERIEANGSAVLSGNSVGAGGRAGREQLQAESAELLFSGGSEAKLESILARGAPATLLAESGGERREATGERVELGLAADGSLRRLAAAGGARIDMVSDEGRQRATGDELQLEFSGEALERLRLRGAPALLEELSVEGATRTLRAAEGDLRFGPEGRPVEGELEGAVELVSGQQRARGRKLIVEEQGRLLVLEGQVSLETPGRSSHGERAVHDVEARTLAVTGEQHTIVTDREGASTLGDFVSGREPVLISAERMDVDIEAKRIVYSAPEGGGRPDVRQGDVALRGDRITLDEITGDLVAEGKVESKLRLAQPDGRKRSREDGLFDPTGLITGTCNVFRYRSEEAVVRYEGEARLEQGEMSLTAEEVEVGLKKPGSEVEYLKARQQAFYDGTEFQAEGEIIDYRKDERLVRVEGGRRPARAVRGEGNLATGAVLELDLDEEGIRIRAPHGGRTRGMSTLSTSAEPQP